MPRHRPRVYIIGIKLTGDRTAKDIERTLDAVCSRMGCADMVPINDFLLATQVCAIGGGQEGAERLDNVGGIACGGNSHGRPFMAAKPGALDRGVGVLHSQAPAGQGLGDHITRGGEHILQYRSGRRGYWRQRGRAHFRCQSICWPGPCDGWALTVHDAEPEIVHERTSAMVGGARGLEASGLVLARCTDDSVCQRSSTP